MPPWAPALIVCAIFSEKLRWFAKRPYCRTEDCVCVAGQWFLWLRQTPGSHSEGGDIVPERCTVKKFLKLSVKTVLTDFCGSHCNVVPHVCLPVQGFGQCDLPVVNVDVELPLQVCVPIDEVPAKGSRSLEIRAKTLLQSSGCCG